MSTPVPDINVNPSQCDTPHLCAANGGDHVHICAAIAKVGRKP